ncbi:hypothetical protein ABT297_04285 [Dactylosporangium sp. NPDC000555]|uniref:hypothetical protein n=1 Tax=Dactylosporangium sp. NPDC000555 TaxID=3154260 RepID=UPI003331A7D9
MSKAKNRLPATEPIRASRTSLVFTTLAATVAALSWPLIISLAVSTHTEADDTLVLTLAAFATTLSLGTLAFAIRYLMRDARRHDLENLHQQRKHEAETLYAELQRLGDAIAARANDTTTELDARLVAIIAQNAAAHAQLAAMAEQISAKLDVMYWGTYTHAAHDLGYAVAGEGKVIDFRGRRGEQATMRLRGGDGA